MTGKALTDGEYRELLVCLIEGVPNRKDLDPEVVRTHLANKTVSHEAVARLLAQRMSASYPITVDYSLTLEQMITAGGYDWVNSSITSESFPITETGKAELNAQLVCFERAMSSDQALAELDKMGLRPATIAELLVFGAKYPQKQLEFSIVGLGSVAQLGDGRNVASLDQHGRRRVLYLYLFDDGWYVHRFLAFPK